MSSYLNTMELASHFINPCIVHSENPRLAESDNVKVHAFNKRSNDLFTIRPQKKDFNTMKIEENLAEVGFS